jgi:transposase InsO family protein
LEPHEHWHIDFAYLKLGNRFYFFVSVLDGCSRAILSWDINETMTEADAEIVLQRARENYPEAKPRIISDNGSQFVAKEFKEFIRLCEMTHVRTSPYYPQSNGKIERFHRSFKEDCIRLQTPLTLEDALRIVSEYVENYNRNRYHSAIGYVTPFDRLEGRHEAIFIARKAKLASAQANRQNAYEIALAS